MKSSASASSTSIICSRNIQRRWSVGPGPGVGPRAAQLPDRLAGDRSGAHCVRRRRRDHLGSFFLGGGRLDDREPDEPSPHSLGPERQGRGDLPPGPQIPPAASTGTGAAALTTSGVSAPWSRSRRCGHPLRFPAPRRGPRPAGHDAPRAARCQPEAPSLTSASWNRLIAFGGEDHSEHDEQLCAEMSRDHLDRGQSSARVNIKLPVNLNGSSIGPDEIPCSSRTLRTNFLCSCPRNERRQFVPELLRVPRTGVSGPRGHDDVDPVWVLPPQWSSIQRSWVSSSSSRCNSPPKTPNPPRQLKSATTSRQWLNAKIGYSMPNSDAIVDPHR